MSKSSFYRCILSFMLILIFFFLSPNTYAGEPIEATKNDNYSYKNVIYYSKLVNTCLNLSNYYYWQLGSYVCDLDSLVISPNLEGSAGYFEFIPSEYWSNVNSYTVQINIDIEDTSSIGNAGTIRFWNYNSGKWECPPVGNCVIDSTNDGNQIYKLTSYPDFVNSTSLEVKLLIDCNGLDEATIESLHVVYILWTPQALPSIPLLLLNDENSIPVEGLAAYWKFDGNANDESGNSNHGFEQGGVSYTQGIIGQAARFDSADDYIEVPNDTSLNFGMNNLTISAWIKTNSTSQDNMIISKLWSSAVGDGGYDLKTRNGNLYFINCCHNGPNGVIGSTAISDNLWHHVVGVRDGNQMKTYIDGNLDEQLTGTSSWNFSSTHPLYIGKEIKETVSFSYNGLIDEVRIYNHALSQSEIQALSVPINYDTRFCGTWSETDGDYGNFCMSLNISETTFTGKYDTTKLTNEGGSDTHSISGTRAGNAYEGSDSRGRLFTLELNNSYSFVSGSYLDPDGGETGTLISP